MNRRDFLRLGAATATAGVAGCSEQGDDVTPTPRVETKTVYVTRPPTAPPPSYDIFLQQGNWYEMVSKMAVKVTSVELTGEMRENGDQVVRVYKAAENRGGETQDAPSAFGFALLTESQQFGNSGAVYSSYADDAYDILPGKSISGWTEISIPGGLTREDLTEVALVTDDDVTIVWNV